MEIEEAFTSYLLAYPGLADLIDKRFYPDEIPENTDLELGPAVSYIKISDVKDHLLSGQSKVESPNFQFSAFAPTKASARAVSNQIKAALTDFSGIMSGITIQRILLLNEIPGKERGPDGSIEVYTEDLEFQIFFEKE